MKEYIQVFTTVEKREDADRIASAVVDMRVAACAQIVGPIQSTYRWKGKVEEAQEWLVRMKTRQGLFSALEKEIKSMHPYEVAVWARSRASPPRSRTTCAPAARSRPAPPRSSTTTSRSMMRLL